ncbi:MAG TPA: UDP-N-acetylmuramate--L-alanine ligase [Conexibacter sp.]|nr:UDP-N-acetylmuramate--L-alanine ligase [Conexibacter sp.]
MTDREQTWAGRRLHFVGIGGAGMSGLALVGRALGAEVSGSDRAESPTLARLRDAGCDVVVGHDAANVSPDVEVVYSTAVPEENPERAVARERGQAELHRADLLAEITALRRCIAVSGTHGKTTTSSMVVHALRGCGMDPGYLVGGDVRSTGSNAGWGAGEWVVVEADESDRSLLKLHPDVAVLTNAELDHHSTYSSRLDVDETFRRFLARAREGIVVWDRPELTALVPATSVEPGGGAEGALATASAVPVVAYDAADLSLNAHGARFDWRGIEVRLQVPGAHNALNATAALEAARLAGADPAQAAAALEDFQGAGRRFELLGTTATGATVYDDYAHHPTEVAATIAAARTLDAKRVVAVFQPHLYSRTQALARDFGRALAQADLTVVLDVYKARERPEDFPGVDGKLIADAAADAAQGRTVAWLPAFDDAERFLRAQLRTGDVCLAMGAGDVDQLGRRLVAAP